MIQTKLHWNGNEAHKFVVSAGWDGIRRAAHRYWEVLVQVLNVPNSGVRTKGRSGKSHTVYPNPSRPGEPPHKRTGFLQRNVKEEFDAPNLTARVGVTVNARYGLFLELGTKRMAARPWLLATLRNCWGQLTALARSGAET